MRATDVIGPTRRRWNKLRWKLHSPEFVIALVLAAILSFLVLVPLANLVWRTVSWSEADIRLTPNAVPGQLTVAHWDRMLFGRSAPRMLWQPLGHTLVTGAAATALAMSLGGILAWLVVRTDLPGRGWLRTLLTLPYMIPSFALALAWETLFKSPLAGGRPGLFQSVFGSPPPPWLSTGPIPIIITMAVHFFPFSFTIIAGALAAVDSQLEESARLLGASQLKIARSITFPLVTPAFLSALVLTFGRTVSAFAIPYFLGVQGRYYTLSTMLFRNFSLGLDVNGYIMAIILIGMTSLVLYVNSLVIGRSTRRFEIISGKGFKITLIKLGRLRAPVFALVLTFAFVTGIAPLGLLGYQSLMLVDGRYDLGNMTLHYWIGPSDPAIAFGSPGLFRNPMILGGAWNSIRLAVLSSFIAAVLGILIGYITVRRPKSLLSRLLEQLSFIPYLFPGIAFGAMYLSMFAVRRGPIPALYGTFALLVLISVVKRLPYSTRIGSSAVTQISKELEEAAEMHGARWTMRLRKIVLPLAMPGVVSGMMVTFISVMRELSLIILLITPSTRVLMTLAYRFAEDDITQLSNALILLVTLITLVGELVVWSLGRGRLARLRERSL